MNISCPIIIWLWCCKYKQKKPEIKTKSVLSRYRFKFGHVSNHSSSHNYRCCHWKRARTWSSPSASVMLMWESMGSVSSMTNWQVSP